MLLTTSAYVEDKDAHANRSQVTGEVAAGNGYASGGAAATCTVALDTATDRVTITLSSGNTVWTTAAGQTLVARKAVWYKNSGTNTTDLLVAVNDFGTDQTASNGGTLTLPASTITLQN